MFFRRGKQDEPNATEAAEAAEPDKTAAKAEPEKPAAEGAASKVKPPRVANVAVALECKVTQIVPVGDTTYTLILGHVLRFHIREGLLRPNGLIDASLLKPVARLGGDEYATIGRVFEMKRPT